VSLVDAAAYDWAAESFAPARLMQPREGLPSAHQMSPRIERIRGPVFVQYQGRKGCFRLPLENLGPIRLDEPNWTPGALR